MNSWLAVLAHPKPSEDPGARCGNPGEALLEDSQRGEERRQCHDRECGGDDQPNGKDALIELTDFFDRERESAVRDLHHIGWRQ